MSASSIRLRLRNLPIASPCNAAWEDMEGTAKVRFCPACRLNVYDLSAMDLDEAVTFLAAGTEGLCVRYFRRADGTILTRDCPVGAAKARRRDRSLVRGAGVYAATMAAAVLFPVMGAVPRPAARHAALQVAVARGDLPSMTQLLETDQGANSRYGKGPTLLVLAVQRGQLEAARLLLLRGADVNARDSRGRTPLQAALAGSDAEMVELLRAWGAEADER